MWAILFASCERLVLESTDNQPASTVRIHTRAADGEAFESPLHAYAFDVDGHLIAHQQYDATDFRLSVPQQADTRIVLLSADPESYDIPTSPSLSSLITMKAPLSASSLDRGYATSPLQMGIIDVHPQSDNTTVTVQMHYQVASLSVLLQQLSDECTSAYLSVASPASGLTFSGTADGTQTSRIPLAAAAAGEPAYPEGQSEPIGTTFATTAPIYLFPTTAPTTFTIAYNDAGGEQYASATYQASLLSGTPYQLNGTYDDGAILLTGTVTPSEWTDPVALSFTFTNGGTTIVTPDDVTVIPDDTLSGIVEVSAIPQPLTLWDGHLVIAAIPSSAAAPTSATLTLLSLFDWDNLTSALNTTTPTQATTYASGYSEYDLTGWRIPTEAEARILSTIYRENADLIDALLLEAQASPVVLTDDKGNSPRYLCEDATKTYSFKNSTITNAGATVKNYHLRLVRTVRVQKQ